MRILVDPKSACYCAYIRNLALRRRFVEPPSLAIVSLEGNVTKKPGFKTSIVKAEKLGEKLPLEIKAGRRDLVITPDRAVVERCARSGAKILDHSGNLYFYEPDSQEILVKIPYIDEPVPFSAFEMPETEDLAEVKWRIKKILNHESDTQMKKLRLSKKKAQLQRQADEAGE